MARFYRSNPRQTTSREVYCSKRLVKNDSWYFGMFSNKLPDTKSRIFGSSNESSSLYARLSEVTASLTRNKPSDYPESNGLPPLRGKMPSSRQKSNTLPHLGQGPQVQQLYEDESRHHKKDGLPNVNSHGDHSKRTYFLYFLMIRRRLHSDRGIAGLQLPVVQSHVKDRVPGASYISRNWGTVRKRRQFHSRGPITAKDPSYAVCLAIVDSLVSFGTTARTPSRPPVVNLILRSLETRPCMIFHMWRREYLSLLRCKELRPKEQYYRLQLTERIQRKVHHCAPLLVRVLLLMESH
eukprot:sb/3467502/